jgi:hypothetical protein
MPDFIRSSHALLLVALAALAAVVASGCRNGQATRIPPPTGMLNQPDAYYTPPASQPMGSSPPVGLGSNRSSENTYDVSSRVAADNQPIGVLEGTPRSSSNAFATAPRGMPVNDGTRAPTWGGSIAAAPPNVAVGQAPLTGLRGVTGGGLGSASPQGLSGQDGQWRSRSSYEATERR